MNIKNIRIDDLEFLCRVAGEPGNEPVILLHGFPESSAMWTRLMEQLAKEGYYCIAPDMRGYSEKASPKGVKNYTINQLGNDVLAVADAENLKEFHLVGHDWGAVIGGYTVFNHPDRIKSWTSLSIPHSRALGKALKTDPVQKKKSRYIGFFLLPYLPEFLIRRNDFKRFRRLWKHSPTEEVEDYLKIFRRKDSLTGALNYYRANIGKGKGITYGDIETPTLFIWGKYDMAIGETAAKLNKKYMAGEYRFVEVEGGHWLVQSRYEEVVAPLMEHLNKYRQR